ncbi:C4-dicarboxylate-specific signal transduction histidine kinase [Pseudomonas duriflava]|uniref:histidine kinase n=1 Tax=Pseudomonas duriflava TaxID=459528 RepID=A0A562QPL8_9PSED|nr:ATP-binding protein [Pseudomonas duriflava]TWI58667.1 C4-dicarboxylate-specific signal transduction histidine kinase [Pseudomonas duriflava]
MSIRFKLIMLVLAVLTPTLLASAFAIYYVYTDQRAKVEESMRATTRAFALAVDRDLSRRDAIIEALAAAPSLDRNDLQEFYEHAKRITPSQENTIILFDLEGQQLLNTRVPIDSELPHNSAATVELKDFAKPIIVSDLYMAPVAQVPSFAVRRPVMRDGRVSYFISMGSFASQLSSVLEDQQLPSGWLAVIIDSSAHVVARNIDPETYIGRSIREPMLSLLLENVTREGFLDTHSFEGTEIRSYFNKAPASGWTAVIALPQDELRRSAIMASAGVIFGSLILLGIALALAFWMGRKIAHPLHILDQTAQALGRGEAVKPVPTGMVETDRTAAVLAQASEEIQSANALLNQRVDEAITQVERSQKALLQGQKLEALGRLTGGIAHDFNNLLQTLTMGLELAELSSTDPRAQKALDACSRSVVRGTKLTRQLMAFSRSRVDEARTVDLRAVLIGMGDLLDGALPSRVTLKLEVPEYSWSVFMDPLQCELAVLNMVFNARDAMPNGGEILVSLSRTYLNEGEVEGLAAGDYIALAVKDNGQGMTEEVQARALEPFFTTKEVGQGTGLGLAQVYGFAVHSQGTVLIDSTLGVGTTVTVLLPMGEMAFIEHNDSVSAEANAPLSARVLLVDDDEQVRQVVGPMLEELGFSVTVANNADEALQCYEAAREGPVEQRPDIIFSDIIMPGRMDGIGLALALREREPDLPIVLATGYTEHALKDYGFKVLSKPYDLKTLAQTLKEELKRKAV